MIESLNRALFLAINAAPDAGFISVALGLLCGEMLIWGLPLMLTFGWLRGRAATRRAMLEILFAALVALAVNQLIGMAWPHPRPFMIGLGHTLIAHTPDPSFPSDHMTLMSVTAASLWLQGWRRTAAVWAAMAFATAWGRIYLGVHFPLDMLGAVVVACATAMACHRFGGPVVDRAHGGLLAIWGRLFSH